MEIFLVTVLITVLGIRWALLRRNLQRLEEQIRQLTMRIFRLENERAPKPVMVEDNIPPAQPVGITEMEKVRPAMTPRVPFQTWEAKTPFAPSEVTLRASAPSRTLAYRLRKYLGDEEWETMLGGSLLNKIGALVLVIGIALFLGYSFTRMAPPGRALTSLTGSVFLLAGGVYLERKQTYRVFARGLIGAGWAALYVTAYAIYALPAARLIENPFVGSVLLFTVATGMVGHSLKYRAQAITAVAYFTAFAALGVTPSSSFALLSLVPLAATLLYFAYRFEWNTMAVFGVVAVYASCIWRGNSGASLAAAESLLVVYWLLFESFDLLRVRRRAAEFGLEFVFPLNAIAFLELSYNAWSAHDLRHIWQGYAFAAALYTVSAVARSVLRSPASFPADADLVTRMRAGSYEAPITLAAALAFLAIASRAAGIWLSVGFAVEAETLYLVGVFLNVAFMRWLGNAAFFLSLARLVTNDVGQDRIVPVTASTRIHAWTLAGLFQAGLFYINRLLQKPNILYSSLAAALISGVLAQELPQRFIGTGWLAFASILFALGLRRMLSEFRFQAYVLAAAGVVITVALDVLTTSLHPWLSPTCALILVYALISHLRFSKAELPHIEHKWLEIAGAAAITTLALLVVWHLAPKNYRGLSSCVLALVLFELGALKLPAVLVRFSYLAMALASLIVIGEQSTHFIRSAPNYVWISYAGAALCLSFLSERAARGEVAIQIAASSAAVVFTLCALWILLPGVAVAPAWSAIAVTLFVLGLRRDLVHERWQGYLVMVASLLNAWDANLHLPAALVVFACYLAQFLSPAQGVTYRRLVGVCRGISKSFLVAARHSIAHRAPLAAISGRSADHGVGS